MEVDDELEVTPVDEVGVDGVDGVGIDEGGEAEDALGVGTAVLKGLQAVARLLIVLKSSDPVPAKTPNIAALAEDPDRSAE